MMGGGIIGGDFGFIWMLFFWGGLIVFTVWLIGVLFPSTSEKRVMILWLRLRHKHS